MHAGVLRLRPATGRMRRPGAVDAGQCIRGSSGYRAYSEVDMNLREQLPGDLGCEPHLGAHALADAPPSGGSAGSRTSARACGTPAVPSVFLGEFALLSAEMLCVQTF